MRRRGELRTREHALAQVREVLAAMKNLSLAESMKLRPAFEAQRSGLEVLERAFADFMDHYGHGRMPAPAPRNVILLIGSERGFCGAFNEAVWQELERLPDDPAARLVLAGSRLALRYGERPRVALSVPAPARPHEVAQVLESLFPLLRGAGGTGPAALMVIYNEDTPAGPVARVARPFLDLQPRQRRLFPYPPVLHRAPGGMLSDLADEYLAALVRHLFLTSSIAENSQRARRLDGAVHEVDRRLQDLRFRLNATMQEGTTEEIEEIMLSIAALM